MGQVFGNDGTMRSEVDFYTRGSLPNVYAKKNSQVSFTWPVDEFDHATSLVQVARLDLQVVGELAAFRDPIPFGADGRKYNFYDPRAAGPITDVPGYSHIMYEEVQPKVDMFFSSNSQGPVLYVQYRPGSHPESLYFQFTGQDSLRIDLEGNLKVFREAKYIELREAVAYQVDGNGTVTDILSWTADWDAIGESGIVKLLLEEYDPTKTLVLKVAYPAFPAMGGLAPID